MKLFKRISVANRIIKAYKRLSALLEDNQVYSEEVKEAFKLFKEGADKIVRVFPNYGDLYDKIVEVLKDV